jgi:hypothetical protein
MGTTLAASESRSRNGRLAQLLAAELPEAFSSFAPSAAADGADEIAADAAARADALWLLRPSRIRTLNRGCGRCVG